MQYSWPSLNYNDWKETYQTLHMWTQIVGKIRLSKSDWVNHSWHSTLYVTPVGLTTSPIYDEDRSFAIDFNFASHELIITTSDQQRMSLLLHNESVADFYKRLMEALDYLKINIHIDPTPNELPDGIPFFEDMTHRTYNPEQVSTFMQVLNQADRLLKQFRADYVGKCSPVHFFWGSFDLAVTRFSGRRAPDHPGGIPHLPARVAKEAYSHEVQSCGFWPGNEMYPHAAFYSYAYPEPPGFAEAKIEPSAAFYHNELREFILPYEAVRKSASPDQDILSFFQSTYNAAADLGHWDRDAVENSVYLKECRQFPRGTLSNTTVW